MDIPISSISRPIIGWLISLQSFVFARPRLDVDIVNDPANLYGQKSLRVSNTQHQEEPILISQIVYDFEFYWNFKLRIKNNSSKTAYNVRIEKIVKNPTDHLDKIDGLVSLKEGEVIELDYKLRHLASKNGSEAEKFLMWFPGHLDKIEIIISYTNEARARYYTRFIVNKNLKTNEHLLIKPK